MRCGMPNCVDGKVVFLVVVVVSIVGDEKRLATIAAGVEGGW
jgi:hypothetical protein